MSKIPDIEEIYLRELIETIRTVHLDMGGKHKYMLTHKSHRLISEIKGWLFTKDQEDIWLKDTPSDSGMEVKRKT